MADKPEKKVVGPGSLVQEDVNIKPLLEDASEFEYVELHNPLSDDFQVMVAQDVPVNIPFELHKDTSGRTTTVTNTEQDVKQIYGVALKNPDHQAKRHVHNTTIIPAGGSMRFRGSEAKVAITQLVNEILQREGPVRLMHDPNKRREVEQRVIRARGLAEDLMNTRLSTPQQQAQAAIEQSNEAQNEQFPELQANEGKEGAGSTDNTPPTAPPIPPAQTTAATSAA